MASLADLAAPLLAPLQGAPPALNIANLALQADTGIADQAFREGVIQQNLPWDLNQIANRRAAQGGYRSGQTGVQMGHVVQLANQQVAQGRYDLQKQLLDISRNRFLTTVGMPMGSGA